MALQLILFQSIIPFAVAYVAGSSHVKSRLPQLLVLGCASLAYGLFNFVVAMGVLFVNTPEWANFIVTVHNSGLLVFSSVTLCGAVIAAYWHPSFSEEARNRRLSIILVYLAIAIFVVLFGFLTYFNSIPSFVVDGDFTMIRQVVLSTTIFLLVSGSIFLYLIYADSKLNIVYWYTLGIALTSIGVASILIEPSLGTPLSWIGRAAQYIGCAFLLVAVMTKSEPAGIVNGWAEAFKRDKRQFDLLFSRMLNGFAYHRIVVENGKPVDYVFLSANEAFEKMTGLKRGDVMGKRVTEVLPGIEKDPADWISTYGKVALTGQPAFFENYAKALDRWYSVSAYSPKKGYFVAIFEDITERKIAEEALKKRNKELQETQLKLQERAIKVEEYATLMEELVRERTRKLELSANYARKLIEASLDPLVTISADGKITDVNKATEEVTGFQRDALIGRSFSEYFTDPAKAEAGYKKVFTEGFVRDYPLAIRSRTSKTIEVLYNASIYTDEQGNVQGVFATARDVTDLNKAQAAVQAERKRFFDVLETLPTMICLISPDYKVVFANRSFREKFGESQGRCCYEYCWGQTGPCTFCESLIPLKTGQPHHWEVNGPDGSIVEAHDYPFTDIDGSRLVLEMDIDITARKKAEVEAVESARKLKDAERLATIGATAGMVGHDIRNPLQVITGDVYLTKQDVASLPEGETKESMQESLESIEKNVEYINKIVLDLQDYVRPLSPVAKEINVAVFIKEILRKKNIPKKIKIIHHIQNNTTILSDSDLLKRIIENLITNALQAMPHGGKLIIQSCKEKDDYIISIEDTGVGIPEEIKPKLFTPMVTTKSKGQGFGLAVVKRLTEALGGTITFESQIGKGTKFIITFAPIQTINGKLSRK